MKKFSFLTGVLAAPVIFSLVFLVTTVNAEPYGWSPNVDNSWGGTPTCTDSKPDKAPILLQPNHSLLGRPSAGEVRLFWHKVPGATGYNVYYGLSPHNYIFSAANLPDTDRFNVRHLTARRYYFAVQAKKGCAASNLSNEWWGVPGGGGGSSTGGGGVLGVATGFTPVKRQVFPTLQPEEETEVTTPQVQGVEEYQQPQVYEQPTSPPVGNPQPFVPQPTPKPLSFWQRLLKAIGLYK